MNHVYFFLQPIKPWPLVVNRRSFGPSVNGQLPVTEVAGWKIIREMLKHVWPKDKPGLKMRVVLAMGLLVGAKVSFSCVCVVHVCVCVCVCMCVCV